MREIQLEKKVYVTITVNDVKEMIQKATDYELACLFREYIGRIGLDYALSSFLDMLEGSYYEDQFVTGNLTEEQKTKLRRLAND